MWISKNSPVDWIETQISRSTQTDIASLCYFRVVFCLFTILFGWRSYTWIGTVPDAFFNPPMFSVASLFDQFPPKIFFQAVDIAIGVFTFTLLFGFLTRLSTLSLLILMIIGNTFSFSLGKIDHNALYLCVLLAMCFQNWGTMFSIDSLLRSQREIGEKEKSVDLSFLGVLISFGFFTAGFGKSLSWVDFDLTTSGFLSWFYDGYFNQGRDQLLASAVLKINSPLLLEFIDISAVIFELGVLLAILSRTGWYSWLTTACLFHLVNCLLLNIAFNANAAVYLAFVPWAQLPICRYCFIKRAKCSLVVFAALGSFLITLWLSPARIPNAGFHVLSLLGISNRLVVSCGIWVAILLIFLASFKAFVMLPTAQLPQHRFSQP